MTTARNRIVILGASGALSAAIALRIAKIDGIEVVDTFTAEDLAGPSIDLGEPTTIRMKVTSEPKRLDAWKQANLRAFGEAEQFVWPREGKQKAQWKRERNRGGR